MLFDIGVRESNGSAVVGDNVGDLVGSHGLLLDLAELESGLLLVDLVCLESALHVVKNTEELAGLFNGDNVHHAEGEPGVSSNFAVNLNHAFLVLNDLDHLLSVQGILQSVLEEHGEGEALSQLVGAGGGADSVLSAELVQHPVGRSC